MSSCNNRLPYNIFQQAIIDDTYSQVQNLYNTQINQVVSAYNSLASSMPVEPSFTLQCCPNIQITDITVTGNLQVNNNQPCNINSVPSSPAPAHSLQNTLSSVGRHSSYQVSNFPMSMLHE